MNIKENLHKCLNENKAAIDKVCRKKIDLQSEKIIPLMTTIGSLENRIQEDQIQLKTLNTNLSFYQLDYDVLEKDHEKLVEERREIHKKYGSTLDKQNVSCFMNQDSDRRDCLKFFKENQMIYIRFSFIEVAPELKLDLYSDTKKLASFLSLVLDCEQYNELEFEQPQSFKLGFVYDNNNISYSIISTVNNKSYVTSDNLDEILKELKEMCGFLSFVQ